MPLGSRAHVWLASINRSLRAKFGVDGLQNAVHASESVAVANEELAVLFSEYKID